MQYCWPSRGLKGRAKQTHLCTSSSSNVKLNGWQMQAEQDGTAQHDKNQLQQVGAGVPVSE